MRYVLYLFTLGLVFTAGMLVGNFYLPERNASLAAAVSVPDLDRSNPALDEISPQRAEENLRALTQALQACPVVVETERERLLNQVLLYLALQDFELKKSVYEAEIAKNSAFTRTTARFERAAAEYAQAKQYTQQLADEMFPPAPPPTPDAPGTDSAETAPEAAASDIKAGQPADKKAPSEAAAPSEASQK